MTKILFVHPDRKIIDIFYRRLKEHVSFHSATDGLSALRQLKLVKPKLIASEVNVPLLSGLALLKFVRAHPVFCVVPFLFLTRQEEELSEALNLGANDWLNLNLCPTETILEKIHYHLKPQTYRLNYV